MVTNIDSMTLEELFAQDTDASIPILLTIHHEEIIWADKTYEQEDCYLRLINTNIPVIFEGKKYLPAHFSFELPSQDGKKVGDTKITISAIDQRVIEIIRSINSNPTAEISAVFQKINDSEIIFKKLYHYKFEMQSVDWNGISAQWKLIFDPAMNVNIPADLATAQRCPAAYEQSN